MVDCTTQPPNQIRLTSPTSILQKPAINVRRRQVHVPDHASADEDVLDAAQVRVLELVQHGDVVELDVEVLVDGFEGPADGDVVFELDCYCCGKGRGGTTG